MATELEDQELYRLSCEILGHSADIRDVKYFPITGFPRGHVILTASRDGTACVWEPELVSSREYILKKITRKHTGYVSALCTIPADESAGRSKRKPVIVPNNEHHNLNSCILCSFVCYRRTR